MAGLGGKFRQTKEAHWAQAIIDRNGYDALFGPHGVVKVLLMTASTGKSAAVNVENYGKAAVCRCALRCPDVEEKTILAIGIALAFTELVVIEYLLEVFLLVIEGTGLVGAVTVACGVVNALPGGNLLRILPSAGGGISDTLEGNNAVKTAGRALDLTAGTVYSFFHKIFL
jgi:hypothetical protein